MQCKYKECLCNCCEKTTKFLDKIRPVVNFIVRLYLANIFLFLGLEKIQNWDATLFLFQNEYQIPLVHHSIATVLAIIIQIVCPIMLVLGYGARFAALVLFITTLLSSLFYQQYVEYYYLMLILALLMCYGPDKFSLGHYMSNKVKSKKDKKASV